MTKLFQNLKIPLKHMVQD